MQSRITGTTMPVLEFVLDPNESIISEAGELSWMGSSIQMQWRHGNIASGDGAHICHQSVPGGVAVFPCNRGEPGEITGKAEPRGRSRGTGLARLCNLSSCKVA